MKKWVRLILYFLLAICLMLSAVIFYYYIPDIARESLDEKYGVKESHYLPVGAMEVHYRDEGPAGASPPLVFLHGTSSSLFTWNAWTEELKDQYRIIRLDIPGFGLTGPHPEDDYSLESYLRFLDSFLAELDVKECVLVGNSLGGEIAWRYALNKPEQVKGLILIGAAGYPVDAKQIPLSELPFSYLWLRIPWIRDLSVKFTNPNSVRNSLEFLYGDQEKLSEETVELYFDMTHREGNRVAITKRMESFSDDAPYEQIPSIDVPTLILWGEKDRLIPVENAWRFHNDLPESRLVIYPEAGHMPMEEIPYESVEAVNDFLSQGLIAEDRSANSP